MRKWKDYSVMERAIKELGRQRAQKMLRYLSVHWHFLTLFIQGTLADRACSFEHCAVMQLLFSIQVLDASKPAVIWSKYVVMSRQAVRDAALFSLNLEETPSVSLAVWCLL